MNSSDITAISSVVIAICALIFSIVQSRKNEKIIRLSNHPKLQVKFVRNRASFDNTTPGIYLENRGLGPAILQECRFEVGSRKFDVASFEDLESYISRLGIEKVEHGRTVILPGSYIPAGGSIDIISLTSSGIHKINNQVWENTEIHGRYSSIFDESFTLKSGKRS